jgi:ABC-2 type transport system permease protein
MATNAITDKGPGGPDFPPPDKGLPPGRGPSELRQDEPGLPRILGMAGAGLVIFGGMSLGFNLYGRSVSVGIGWSILILALGMAGLLFHAAFDQDVQFRRMYMAFGCALLAMGALLCISRPFAPVGALFRFGIPCLLLGLLFLLAFLRNETDDQVRTIAHTVLGVAGLVMAAIGLVGGCVRGDFLLPYGLVLALLGLLYLTAFIASRGISDDRAYYAALVLTAAGTLVVLFALGWSLFSERGSTWFVSYGAVLLIVGLLYALIGCGLGSESSLLILTRRELGSFFYSPIAYLVLLGFSFFSWVSFKAWLDILTEPRNTPIEPIVQNYLVALFPVIAVIFVVPALTMRLLSEEQRSGTMEVLLTAPVDETVIVLSKFLAALIGYLVVWIPFGLYLLAIPLAGGSPFDYRPLLSFLVALIATGAAFVSMGLFFSSLTKNQIASAVLCFAGMGLLTYVYFAAHQAPEESASRLVLMHISYIDLWLNTLEGKITPRFLLFPVSMTILFLFLTVKVLESRKWR